MAKRQLKCYGSCGKKYPIEELKKYSNKNYCEKCYDEVVKINDDRVALYNMIKTHYNVTFPTSLHLGQIKRLKDKGYSYEDMTKGLTYCVNKLNMKFESQMGFGWVSNNIEEALKYYKEIEVKNNNIFETINEKTFESQKVVIRKPNETNSFKESKIIKLEDILNDR